MQICNLRFREFEMGLLSTGEAAARLGITRDALLYAFRSGAPEPDRWVGGRRVFDYPDLYELALWFKERGRPVDFQFPPDEEDSEW